MKDILDKRVYIITFIFGLGGGVLSRLLDVHEISSLNMTSVTIILSFVVSLFISLHLKQKWTSLVRKNTRTAALVLLLISLALAYNYFNQFDRLTFTFTEGFPEDSNGKPQPVQTITHLKGCWYSIPATRVQQEIMQTSSYRINDSTLLKDHFGGISGLGYIWDAPSVTCAKRTLFLSYVLFVLFLCATISLLAEVLHTKYKHKTAPEKGSDAGSPTN